MIPLRLSVRNFLCYRDDVPALDLRGIHVACLCGANGHGKSALLDAMTWCLWGHARTGTQNHNDLIAYGASECRVELDFLARGQEHRAIRRRRSSGQGRTEVDLFILDSDGQARSISGNTVRETNWKIQNLVGMDYMTFVNTAFLLQGRSDEFTRKTPAERKAVLSSVLGLSLYESLQDSAAGQRDHWKSEVVRTEGALAQNLDLLDAIPDPEVELAEIRDRLSRLVSEIESASAEALRLRDVVTALRRKQEEVDTIERRIDTLRVDIDRAESAVAATESRLAHAHQLEARSEEISAGERELVAAKAELDRLISARNAYDRLRTRRVELEAAVERERASLSAEASQLKNHMVDVLQPAANRSDGIAHDLTELGKAEASLASDQELLDADVAEAADIQRAIALAEADLQRCIEEGKELRIKQTEMKSADAVCPLCRTLLTEDACGDITAWYEDAIRAKLERHDEIKASLEDFSGRLASLQDAIPERTAGLSRQQAQIQQRRGRLEQEQRQCQVAAEQLQTSRPRLELLESMLSKDSFADEERSAIAAADAELASLGYDEDRFDAVTRQVRSLQHWETEVRQLQDSQARLPEDEAALSQARDLLERLGRELQSAEASLNDSMKAVADLPERQREAEDSEKALADLFAERDALLARQGRLHGDAERRAAYVKEIDGLESRRASSNVEQGIYSDLHSAFGRSGVPAMLIDAAVPRIEAEANLLLGRMTDNRLAVKLETQRVRQAGNVSETLDILVSDELGLRNYDLFSGGEAFRINLALRIALSKVLAQRMGLPMPTLFIDEGFGTQDAAGRERIVDAIASIQEDFEKIIVITHLDDLKDLFPVRIEVQKTGDGSQFWLS